MTAGHVTCASNQLQDLAYERVSPVEGDSAVTVTAAVVGGETMIGAEKGKRTKSQIVRNLS